VAAEAIVELAAAGLAAWAAWLTVPRPPALDWQRLFKTTLSTTLYGRVVAESGTKSDWEAAVGRLVPYNPLARDAMAKLSAPAVDGIEPPALPGERALVESLSALASPADRYAHMFSENELTRDALMSDPASLGAAFDPAGAIGVGADWEAIAAWGEPVQAGLARKFSHVVVAGVQTELASVMADQIGGRGLRLPDDGVIEALDQALRSASDRLVLVAEGAGISVILQAMHGHPGLRDRVCAVISLGGDVQQSDAQKSWMEQNFTQQAMDTELNRSTPYISTVQVDPSAPLAADWDGQCWPEPAPDRTGRRPIDPIDLGPLPADWLTLEQVGLARALWVLLAFRL
jgi:hypothetical protein